jgi:hypothetical protein
MQLIKSLVMAFAFELSGAQQCVFIAEAANPLCEFA